MSALFFDEILVEPFVWEDADLLLPERPGSDFELDATSSPQPHVTSCTWIGLRT